MEQHKSTPFKRSILFVNFTAEETGMNGSELFAQGEILPTKNMVGLLNIDGMNGLFFRSDHFSMAKQGVPALLFMSLGDTDPDYITHKYHKEADDYSP